MGKFGDDEKLSLPSHDVDVSAQYPDDPPAYHTVIDDDSANQPSTARGRRSVFYHSFNADKTRGWTY